MAQAIAAYLHYLSIFILFALLSIEHVQFKLPLDLPRVRSLMLTDIAYWVSALLVLLSGAARLFWYGKGAAYYLHNYLLHAKLALFVMIVLLSILPSITFCNWRSDYQAGRVPAVSPQRARWVTLCIRLELLLLLLMPLLAVFMACGYGMS